MNPNTTPILLLDLWEHAYYLDVSCVSRRRPGGGRRTGRAGGARLENLFVACRKRESAIVLQRREQLGFRRPSLSHPVCAALLRVRASHEGSAPNRPWRFRISMVPPSPFVLSPLRRSSRTYPFVPPAPLPPRQHENRKDVYITNFWASVDWPRVATRYAEASGEVVPEALPSADRWAVAGGWKGEKGTEYAGSREWSWRRVVDAGRSLSGFRRQAGGKRSVVWAEPTVDGGGGEEVAAAPPPWMAVVVRRRRRFLPQQQRWRVATDCRRHCSGRRWHAKGRGPLEAENPCGNTRGAASSRRSLLDRLSQLVAAHEIHWHGRLIAFLTPCSHFK